jgi:hypothetical protein
MQALHKNVEWTEVIEVLTPFSGGIYREREIFTGLLALTRVIFDQDCGCKVLELFLTRVIFDQDHDKCGIKLLLLLPE